MSCNTTPQTVRTDDQLLALIPVFNTDANMYNHFLNDTRINNPSEVPYTHMSPHIKCAILRIKNIDIRRQAYMTLDVLKQNIEKYIDIIREYHSRQSGNGADLRKQNASNIISQHYIFIREIETLMNNIQSGKQTMGGKSRRKYRNSYKKRIRKHNNTKRNRSQKA